MWDALGVPVQHACAIARSLGMSTVFVHRFAGILSAYGISLADLVREAQVIRYPMCTNPFFLCIRSRSAWGVQLTFAAMSPLHSHS